MNLILVKREELVGNSVVLDDHRAKHVVKVLHCNQGDRVKIGILYGAIGTGTISAIHKKYPFRVEIETRLESQPPEKSPVDFILALPRPIMLRRILGQIAVLGVDSIHIINANRVEKSFWEAGIIEEEKHQEHLIQGLEQAVDTMPPKVMFHKKFKPFIEDFFPAIAQNYTDLLYAHPEGSLKLHETMSPNPGKILVAIGPEGGWVDYELEKFKEYGFKGFTIGKRILKVDTAVVNIHGRIMAMLDCLP